MTPGPFRAAFDQFWVLLIAILIIVLLGPIVGIPLAVMRCDDCRNWAAKLLLVWATAVIVLGPIPAFRYQHRKVKSGERAVAMGVMYAIAGSVASSLLAVAVIFGAVYLDQRFSVFGLFAGDGGFALIGLGLLMILSVCLTTVFALTMFWRVRKITPNSSTMAGRNTDAIELLGRFAIFWLFVLKPSYRRSVIKEWQAASGFIRVVSLLDGMVTAGFGILPFAIVGVIWWLS